MDIIESHLKKQYESINKKFKFEYNTNNTKVAVMVEPRRHHLLKYIVTNVMYNLGPEWNLHLFTFDYDFVKTELVGNTFKLSKLTKGNLELYEQDNILKMTLFWEQIKEENILYFETDSFIMNKMDDSVFINQSFIGGVYTYYNKQNMKGVIHPFDNTNVITLHNSPLRYFSINGGFSFRKRSKMIECIKKVSKEDIISYRKKYAMDISYYEKHIGEDTFFQHALEILGYQLPNIDECIHFCENLSYNLTCSNSFGIHNINKKHAIDNRYNFIQIKFSDSL